MSNKTFIPLNKVERYNGVVFCFHWVGGNGFSFQKFATSFLAKSGLRAYGVSLSSSAKGEHPRSVQEAAQYVFEAFKQTSFAELNPLNTPILFLGHSYGGIVAFELCKLLQCHREPLHVVKLIVSCVRSPKDLTDYNQTNAMRANHLKSKEDLVAEVIRIGGLPDGVDLQFLWTALSTIRDDFRAFESYREINNVSDVQLNVPIVCVSGDKDVFVPSDETRGWLAYAPSAKHFVNHQLSNASHFYLSDDIHLRSLSDIVAHSLLF